MEEIVIGIILLVLIVILAKIFRFDLKKIKEISEKENNDSEILQELKSLPADIEICKEILEELNNKQVEIVENKEYNASLYTVYNNRITIGNIKNKIYTVQTIAHECIHSVQDKEKTIFNFVISNIYMLYYFCIMVGTIINKAYNLQSIIFSNTIMNVVILLMLALCQYAIRSMLETEAILESKYIAEKYFQKKGIKKEIIGKILKKYNETNQIGINLINYMLIAKNLLKVVMYMVLAIALKII